MSEPAMHVRKTNACPEHGPTCCRADCLMRDRDRYREALEQIAALWEDATVGEFWRKASNMAREALR